MSRYYAADKQRRSMLYGEQKRFSRSFCLSNETIEAIKKASDKENVSMSALIETMVRDKLGLEPKIETKEAA